MLLSTKNVKISYISPECILVFIINLISSFISSLKIIYFKHFDKFSYIKISYTPLASFYLYLRSFFIYFIIFLASYAFSILAILLL